MKESELDQMFPQWKKDLVIDKFALEVECERQAALFAKYALEHVKKLTQMEELKLEIDVHKRETKLAKEVLFANWDMKVRRGAAATNEKITEAVVKSRIYWDKTFQAELKSLDVALDEKERQLIKKKMDVEFAAGLREAFKQKKDMIGHEVFLWGANYYADPPTEERSIERMNQQLNTKGRRFKNEKAVE